MLLYSTAPFARVYEGPLPVSRRSSLAWVGFTKEGCVATYDSHCVVRALACLGNGTREWVVLMNVKQLMRDKYGQGETRACGRGG